MLRVQDLFKIVPLEGKKRFGRPLRPVDPLHALLDPPPESSAGLGIVFDFRKAFGWILVWSFREHGQ